jgi:hypothetical protein
MRRGPFGWRLAATHRGFLRGTGYERRPSGARQNDSTPRRRRRHACTAKVKFTGLTQNSHVNPEV